MEVDPNLAYETDATIEEAARFHDWVERPNLYVKIPATEPGLPAIEEMIARGRNINVTLIFSLERHMEVAEAYIRGLERLVEAGGDPAKVGSVASYFVSRVDTEADRRLDEAGHPELKGKLAVANAKLAYQNYKEKFSGERWEALAAKGATPQWCLWASTSTKNPEYRDVLYIEELIGPDTVNTMPRETIEAFQDHGVVELTLEKDLDEARRVFEQLAEAGVDYDDVTDTLEREGVQKFIDSFTELLEGIEAKRGQLVAGVSELYWEEAGEGPAVVLVHEAIADSRMWEPQWRTFPRAHRTVRYDMRGYGRSPIGPGTYLARPRPRRPARRGRSRANLARRRLARRDGLRSRSPSRSPIASRSSCSWIRAGPEATGPRRLRRAGPRRRPRSSVETSTQPSR